jgi:hypothetical protein
MGSMASHGKTYKPIETQTLGTAVASVTFSSIPDTYTDLVLVFDTACGSMEQQSTMELRFNGDTARQIIRQTRCIEATEQCCSLQTRQTPTAFRSLCLVATCIPPRQLLSASDK